MLVPDGRPIKHDSPTRCGSSTVSITPPITTEDRERTQMYAQERAARQPRRRVLDRGLAGLARRPRSRRAAPAGNLKRVVQLLNKTNQLNLRTRRITEKELTAVARGGARDLAAVTVAIASAMSA